MSIAVKSASPEGGAPVHPAFADSKYHPLVRLTSMYGSFVLETVGEWVQKDAERQEQGIPDSLEYLTGYMRLLMDAIERQRRMGELCRLIGDEQKNQFGQLEATYQVLKDIGLDTSGLEEGIRHLRAQSALLERLADAHSGNAAHVIVMINRLEARVNALLTGRGLGSEILLN